MKKNILLLFACCCFAKGFSQRVSIKLSFEWKNEEVIFLDSTFYQIPYLNITYINELNYPIYFSRVSSNEQGIPKLSPDMALYNYRKPVDFDFYDYSKEKYNVFIGNYISIIEDLNVSWEVLADTINLYEEHEIEIINNELTRIYFWYDKVDNKSVQNLDTLFIDDYLRIPDYKEKLVFLQSGEAVTDSYNLLGFSILKGEYTFQFESNQRSSIIYINSLSFNKYLYNEKELPEKIGEYRLYKGEFCSNKAYIKFD